MMCNNHLNNFVKLFEALSDASYVLWIECEKRDNDVVFFSHVERFPEEVKEATWNNVEYCLSCLLEYDYEPLENEVSQNLFSYKECPQIYILDVLRRFKDIVPYIGIFEKERKYGKAIQACASFVKKWDHDTFQNDAEKYTLECLFAVDNFFELLDAKSLDFGLDIMSIQENAGLYIYQRGTASTCSLYTNGYKKQLDEIWKEDPKRTISLKMSKHDAGTTDGGYQYDIDMILKIYKFCQGDIFDISFGQFITAVENADFSPIINTDGLIKNKFYYSISIIKKFVHSSGWYKKAANSINIEPTVCKKGGVDDNWKKAINAIK